MCAKLESHICKLVIYGSACVVLKLGEDVVITVIGSRVHSSFISANAMSIGSFDMVFNVIVGMQKTSNNCPFTRTRWQFHCPCNLVAIIGNLIGNIQDRRWPESSHPLFITTLPTPHDSLKKRSPSKRSSPCINFTVSFDDL